MFVYTRRGCAYISNSNLNLKIFSLSKWIYLFWWMAMCIIALSTFYLLSTRFSSFAIEQESVHRAHYKKDVEWKKKTKTIRSQLVLSHSLSLAIEWWIVVLRASTSTNERKRQKTMCIKTKLKMNVTYFWTGFSCSFSRVLWHVYSKHECFCRLIVKF